MRKLQAKSRRAKALFFYSMGQRVRITKENMRFAMGFEQNWTLEEINMSKVLRKSSRPVYKMEILLGDHIHGQFSTEDLTSVKFTRKKLPSRQNTEVRRGFR
jgi:hypothetical protein